jgi:glucose-1-phosphate adenylyltransferase
MLHDEKNLFAYKFNEYWKDVGTIDSYWESNMELIKTVPDFNLYEDFWRIYTSAIHQPPQYTGENSDVRASFLSEGCEIYGTVVNSVIGPGVIVKEGARVVDSIIMEYCVVGENSTLDKCILDERCVVGTNVRIGYSVGEDMVNELKPDIYNTGLTVLGEFSIIPNGVSIGKNCVIDGVTAESDYGNGLELASGKSIIKERQAAV